MIVSPGLTNVLSADFVSFVDGARHATSNVFDFSSGTSFPGNSATVVVSVSGIAVGYGCTLTGNTSRKNGESLKGVGSIAIGINVGNGCVVRGNTSYDNGRSAVGDVYGILVGSYCVVNQNTAYANGIDAPSVTNMLTAGGCATIDNVAP